MNCVGVIGGPSEGNLELVEGLRQAGIDAALMRASEALAVLELNTVLVRLDVLPTLDGVEPGLDLIPQLEQRGIRVLNRADAMLAAHDKLRTSVRLAAAGLPHPRTEHLLNVEEVLELALPVVLKPRFGSWGSDVWRCRDAGELRQRVGELGTRSWFRRHGVLAQELLAPPGRDLRLLVAGGEVVGAAHRVAAPGEWRTNVSIGGRLERAVPPPAASELGLEAAAALGTDLAGVDLLPTDGGYVVLELNGAADFSEVYSLPGRDVYRDIVAALELDRAARPARRQPVRGAH